MSFKSREQKNGNIMKNEKAKKDIDGENEADLVLCSLTTDIKKENVKSSVHGKC